MIAFIDDHRAELGVEPICQVLPIAPNPDDADVAPRVDPGELSPRARRDAALQGEIRRLWEANFQVYGVREVWRQRQREAIAAPRCQVAGLSGGQADEGDGAGGGGARQNREDHAKRPGHAVSAGSSKPAVAAAVAERAVGI